MNKKKRKVTKKRMMKIQLVRVMTRLCYICYIIVKFLPFYHFNFITCYQLILVYVVCLGSRFSNYVHSQYPWVCCSFYAKYMNTPKLPTCFGYFYDNCMSPLIVIAEVPLGVPHSASSVLYCTNLARRWVWR